MSSFLAKETTSLDRKEGGKDDVQVYPTAVKKDYCTIGFHFIFLLLRFMTISSKCLQLDHFLQNGKRRKGTMRLRLLLTYVQNGIEEPWQRIPSITALFAAEASFILLEQSHHHYAALSKFLVRSSRMNRKVILL